MHGHRYTQSTAQVELAENVEQWTCTGPWTRAEVEERIASADVGITVFKVRGKTRYRTDLAGVALDSAVLKRLGFVDEEAPDEEEGDATAAGPAVKKSIPGRILNMAGMKPKPAAAVVGNEGGTNKSDKSNKRDNKAGGAAGGACGASAPLPPLRKSAVDSLPVVPKNGPAFCKVGPCSFTPGFRS